MKNISSFTDFVSESTSSSLENYKNLIQKYDFHLNQIDDERSRRREQEKGNVLKAIYKSLSFSDKKEAFQTYMELLKKNFPLSNYPKMDYDSKKFVDFLGV